MEVFLILWLLIVLNEVNLSKHKVVIHVAADNKYLIKQGGLSDFAVNNLKFFEEKDSI